MNDEISMNIRNSVAILLVLFWAMTGATGLALGVEMNMKIGINRVSASGMTYTHDDGATEYTNSEGYVGNDIFFEYVISQHFSLEIDSTITGLQRTYTLEAGGTTISDNVTETLSYITYGANLYFNRADKRGLKFLIGISTGTATVTHEFEGGTLGTASSTNSPGLTIFKLGMDWITKFAGFRLQYKVIEGSAGNTTEVAGVTQTADLNGSFLVLGVFAFF